MRNVLSQSSDQLVSNLGLKSDIVSLDHILAGILFLGGFVGLDLFSKGLVIFPVSSFDY